MLLRRTKISSSGGRFAGASDGILTNATIPTLRRSWETRFAAGISNAYHPAAYRPLGQPLAVPDKVNRAFTKFLP